MLTLLILTPSGKKWEEKTRRFVVYFIKTGERQKYWQPLKPEIRGQRQVWPYRNRITVMPDEKGRDERCRAATAASKQETRLLKSYWLDFWSPGLKEAETLCCPRPRPRPRLSDTVFKFATITHLISSDNKPINFSFPWNRKLNKPLVKSL